MNSTKYGRAVVIGFVLAVLLVVLTVSAVCSAATLDFNSSRSLMLVQVTIDGVERTMVFDTGAQRTIIDDPRNIERSVNVTIDKRTMRLFIAYAPLHLNASETIKGVKASGLLGQDVLRAFKHVSIDYANKTITLE